MMMMSSVMIAGQNIYGYRGGCGLVVGVCGLVMGEVGCDMYVHDDDGCVQSVEC